MYIKGGDSVAIDKEKTKEFIDSIDELFESIPVNNEALKNRIRDLVLGPALEDVKRVIDESRPPVLMVIGRSGHGQSSLINAIAGKEDAAVSDAKPQDPHVEPHLLAFSGEH